MESLSVGADELRAQAAVLLPARETLDALVSNNIVTVVGVNLAIAVNAATINSSAAALANQSLSSAQ